MAAVHLDPWTDIVNVNWPRTYTHVAFELYLQDADITGSSHDYPALPSGFYTTSHAEASQKVRIRDRYRMRTSGATQSWSAASTSDLVISGYTLDSNTSERFTKTYAECTVWSPIFGNRGAPSFTETQYMLGFDGHRAQDSLISVPVATGEKFETFTTAALAYHTHPLTACSVGLPDTTLNENTLERIEVAANVIGGLSVSYRGTACTIIGLWTPLLGLTPNVAIAAVQIPKRLFVLASINS
jgi:hypothetical protein